QHQCCLLHSLVFGGGIIYTSPFRWLILVMIYKGEPVHLTEFDKGRGDTYIQ
ncbi:hypothetical protein E9K_04242, partial [Moraxella catarrhalis 103P14B1]